MNNLETFECSGQNLSNLLPQFLTNKSIPLQVLYPLQFHEILFLYSFLAQAIYTLLNRSPLKWKFLRLASARVKFCQILYANCEMTSRFLCKFCIPLQFHERLLLCTFLAQPIYTLVKRSPSECTFLRLRAVRSKFIKFVMSILKWQVNSSSNFESFFIAMTRNSSVDFELILFLLWIKGFHQYPNLETLNFSGENLPYS